MNQETPISTQDCAGHYTFRSKLPFAIPALLLVASVIYDLLTRQIHFMDYILIGLVILDAACLIYFGGDRKVAFKNQSIYINDRMILRNVKKTTLISPRKLELRYNFLWILIVEGDEQDIAKIYRGLNGEIGLESK